MLDLLFVFWKEDNFKWLNAMGKTMVGVDLLIILWMAAYMKWKISIFLKSI